MRYLNQKTILVISPQPWEHIQISKHHYAIELALAGNTVFFLEPPVVDKFSPGAISIRESTNHKNVHIITYRPFFPRKIRFHFHALYRVLIYVQIKLLLKTIRQSVDLVWSFDFNLYPDLSAFSADKVIFHPVDPLSNRFQINVAKDADFIVSVSQKILDNFKCAKFSEKKKLLINHGVAKEFIELASADDHYQAGDVTRVGYVGNLDRKIIDWLTIRKLVIELSDVEFHFWGPYSATNENVRALLGCRNVVFHGETQKKRLTTEMSMMNCFILLYLKDKAESDLSNAHKILEYFSTGCVVFSVPIQEYLKQEPLIVFVRSDSVRGKVLDLKKLVGGVNEYNGEDLVRKRKAIALANTYDAQLNRLDQVLSSI